MRILEYPNDSLLQVCSDVINFDSQLHKHLDIMMLTMRKFGGVGLAANQVGLAYRAFVMIGEDERVYELINPKIIEHGEIKQKLFREGCLSSKNVYAYVPRYETVLVEYQDRHGEFHKLYATKPRDSVCIQHEMDHLDGIMWWDRLPRNIRRRLIRKYEKLASKD